MISSDCNNVEFGDTLSSVTQQMIVKYAFECEFCFTIEKSQQHYNEVRLVAAKVTSEQPSKKSYIVICPFHFQYLEQYLEKFLEKSLIKYSVSQLEIKKAKLVKIPEIDLREAREKISGNFCCRVLSQRHIKADQTIQLLNTNDLLKTMEAVCEKKKIALERTLQKFKQYSNQNKKMTERQKFLIYHFYKRLERKSNQIFQMNDVSLSSNDKLSSISMSMSGVQQIDTHS